MSSPRLERAVRAHLDVLYDPVDSAVALRGLLALVADERPAAGGVDRRGRALGADDVWLIAYADHVSQQRPVMTPDGPLPIVRPPVQVLGDLLDHELAGVVNGVHLLPFYPSTSDDGFAVTDHLAVDPAVGSWADIEAIGAGRRLMVDAVVNHVSAGHPWVQAWRRGVGERRVLEVGPDFDTSQVVRPRTSPLRTPFDGPGGVPRFAWTTFSADQVDLDYASPAVLVAMTEVLLRYAAHGADVIRLDAVGFLWKTSGTPCIHLPQTHEVIRLWRTVLDHCAPGTMLITETNVPHEENVAYFGEGDEAHLVYQFPLAPLVLAAFTWGSAQALSRWAASLETPAPGTTWFNFLGSHDGVGMRPAEGLLAPAQVEGLCALAVAAGGGVSHRTDPVGTQVPYELNTTVIDALLTAADDGRGVMRILGAHAILLALQGVPGLWLGAVFGVTNDRDLVRRTGALRSVNRSRPGLEDLRSALADEGSLTHAVHRGLADLVALRRDDPAFAPDSPQRIIPSPGWLFAVQRGTSGRRTVVLVSVSDVERRLDPVALIGDGRWELVGPVHPSSAGAQVLGPQGVLRLPPYGIAWLREIGWTAVSPDAGCAWAAAR